MAQILRATWDVRAQIRHLHISTINLNGRNRRSSSIDPKSFQCMVSLPTCIFKTIHMQVIAPYIECVGTTPSQAKGR